MKHIDSQWSKVGVSDGSEMRLFIARPDGSGKAPCVIVFQEAFGVNAHIQDVAMRIASLGYIAVAPELFHRTAPGFIGDYDDLGKSKPHMSALTNNNLENDIYAVNSWLQNDRQADSDSIAAIGFCIGGKAAFIANALLPLKAAVSYYGSSIPSVLHFYVNKQSSPLLLFWAGNDKHIDADKRFEIEGNLRKAGKEFINVEFSSARHGFFCEARKSYLPDAASESWAMLAFFLKNRLHKNLAS
jgi:carboxymethylenebutenolidase